MADGRAGGSAGIGLGGILVIIGIVVAIVWSLWLGILIAIVGLVAFGGFARVPLSWQNRLRGLTRLLRLGQRRLRCGQPLLPLSRGCLGLTPF